MSPIIGLIQDPPMLPYTLEYGKLAVGLTKAAAKAVTGDMDGAWKAAQDAISFKDKALNPEEAAKQLVSIGLLNGALELVKPPVQRRWTEQLPQWVINDDFKQIVTEANSEPFELTPDFLANLPTLPAVAEFQRLLAQWLDQAGCDGDPASLAARLPWMFADALAREYRKKATTYAALDDFLQSEVAAAWRQERSWERSKVRFRKQLEEPLFGEPYSLPQLYVEPFAFTTEVQDVKDEDNGPKGRPNTIRRVVRLFNTLNDWLGGTDRHDSVRVITGELGSGKSSSARMWAAERLQFDEWRVLFIPLHLFYQTEGQSFAAALETYAGQTGAPKNLLDEDGGPAKLLLIFDGLDELAGHGKGGVSAAATFATGVVKTLDQRNASRLRLKVLFCGRPIATHEIEPQVSSHGKVLELLPFHVSEARREDFTAPSRDLLKDDLRETWWRKFATLTKQAADVPAELRDNDLADITVQPLHCHLVAMARQEGSLLEPGQPIRLCLLNPVGRPGGGGSVGSWPGAHRPRS